jgi:hypothetical protein
MNSIKSPNVKFTIIFWISRGLKEDLNKWERILPIEAIKVNRLFTCPSENKKIFFTAQIPMLQSPTKERFYCAEVQRCAINVSFF